MSSTDLQSQLVIGIVRGSHGLSGAFKIESTSGEIEHFFDLTEVTIRKGSLEKVFKVEEVKGSLKNLIMNLSGINSPEEAKSYSGCEILVPREKASSLKGNEFYVEDLKGCSLLFVDNNGLTAKSGSAPIVAGTITGVMEGGAGDLLEVDVSESVISLFSSKDGSISTTVKRLVPFRKEFIGTVDIESKQVHLMNLWILE